MTERPSKKAAKAAPATLPPSRETRLMAFRVPVELASCLESRASMRGVTVTDVVLASLNASRARWAREAGRKAAK